MLIIPNATKPSNCYNCPFNCNDMWCSLAHITIDRDDYSPMDNECPLFDIPDNATNGDVIKALFPNMSFKIVNELVWTNLDGETTRFITSWWNAPYTREVEE